MQEQEKKEKDIKIVDTSTKEKHGENRCPKCGASDVTFNEKKGKLICNYCYTEFDAEDVEGFEKDTKNLSGETRGSGTKDIKEDTEDVITLRCGGCGAEVVINTKESMNARCHWCRSILSINSQIDNGAVPDVVLPFKLEKKEGEERIRLFVDKRKFFAHPIFKKEFTTSNVIGVYFPYMIVDANAHANFNGKGEHLVRKYTVEHNDKEETKYDADLYRIEREFDITIKGLTIESNSDRLDKKNKQKTNNVINAIMPFDTENCVKYKANYLVGYSSEKRDVNISNIEDKVNNELKDVTRYALNKEMKFYDRGIKWEEEKIDVKGKQWISAYLPVWLYSYQDSKKILHYVAVNARTGETMGSIPMNQKKLIFISFLIEILVLFIALLIDQNSKESTDVIVYILFSIIGPIFYGIKYSKYRNSSARHNYESVTPSEITNLQAQDELIKHERGLDNSTMNGANNKRIEGEKTSITTTKKE